MKMIQLFKDGSTILAPEPDLEYLESVGWSQQEPKAKAVKKTGAVETQAEID
jgi:hypothetical protein